ncbi:sensor histidine kinase [Peribacillus asahii]|uniref:sensor histidine kinase n=1 Tax=Peribacillus asahii TaxID=228899 RepID=UPI00207A0314|nr:HAMP domain-containing sensor histidine kinase [Peribacillus asahii]USK62415.1 HAMP domain-containing histidine kinase [Peribacillus asahii]
MKVNGIVIKLGTIIMVLFLIVLVPLGFFIDRIFLQIYSTEVHQNVNTLSRTLTNTLNKTPESGPEFYEYLSNITGKKIVVFNEEGVISSYSVFNYIKGESLPNEIVRIMKEGKHFERQYVNPKTNEHFFYVGRPIIEDGTLKGGVLVFSSIDEIHGLMHNIRGWIIISIIGSIVLALGYTWFVAKKLSSPLIKMEKATRDIAKGNLETKVRIKSKDEMGSLAKAINDLSIELNNYRVNRSELLANISHELRTPISYLKGYAQLLRNHQYHNKEELESYSLIIENESDRLAKLIQDLFELSKMEEGRISLYMQSIDMEDVIESAVQKVKLKAMKKKINLLFNLEEELPLIISDGSRVEQILLNLLENAINYTEQGSVVVKAKKEKDYILVSVKDTGAGIPEKDLPFIFDRFHRVEKSRSREMGGTGLGLAIVYELVKQLKGRITVESELGYGSEFLLRLPYRLEENRLISEKI